MKNMILAMGIWPVFAMTALGGNISDNVNISGIGTNTIQRAVDLIETNSPPPAYYAQRTSGLSRFRVGIVPIQDSSWSLDSKGKVRTQNVFGFRMERKLGKDVEISAGATLIGRSDMPDINGQRSIFGQVRIRF